MDAVNGSIVFVTEPLHAFEAEKGKRKALVTDKVRTGHQEGMAFRQVSQGQAETDSHPVVTGHQRVSHMGNKARPRVSG